MSPRRPSGAGRASRRSRAAWRRRRRGVRCRGCRVPRCGWTSAPWLPLFVHAFYGGLVGERNRDRQLREARTAYVGALARFREALAAFDGSGTPMDPGPDPEPYPWTDEQWRTFRAVTQATAELVDTRRTWDG